jgi:hypothetical protein
VDLDTFRDARSGLKLDLDDAFLVDETIPVRAAPENPAMIQSLVATVVDTESDTQVAHATLGPDEDGWFGAELPPLPAGTYRLAVGGGGFVKPVADLFTVFDPALAP